MGKKLKNFLTLLLIFAVTTLSAFYFEEYYRSFVRYIFIYLSNNNILFVGKNFHLFASNYFVLSFGLFCVILTNLISGKSLKSIFWKLFFVIFLFVFTTFAICFIGVPLKIAECTACNDGMRKLQYNQIDYDSIFISSLIVSLVPLVLLKIKKNLRISGK